MKAWFKNTWVYWWFVTAKQSKHTPSPWIMRESGMGKFKCCTQCGKVLELI